MTDQEIAKKLQKKDLTVFDYIMANYNKLLWVIVGNILEKVGSSEDIEDCISDIYIKLLEKPKMYDPKKGSLKSFLAKSGKNIAIDRYRRLAKEKVIPINKYIHTENYDDIEQLILSKENQEIILIEINQLKEPDKEILVRRYFFNERVKTISEKMNLPSKQIENRLYQGKLKLKELLTDKEVF